MTNIDESGALLLKRRRRPRIPLWPTLTGVSVVLCVMSAFYGNRTAEQARFFEQEAAENKKAAEQGVAARSTLEQIAKEVEAADEPAASPAVREKALKRIYKAASGRELPEPALPPPDGGVPDGGESTERLRYMLNHHDCDYGSAVVLSMVAGASSRLMLENCMGYVQGLTYWDFNSLSRKGWNLMRDIGCYARIESFYTGHGRGSIIIHERSSGPMAVCLLSVPKICSVRVILEDSMRSFYLRGGQCKELR